MITRNTVAFEIYNFLKIKAGKLPVFSYQLGNDFNDCFVFTPTSETYTEYNQNEVNYTFDLRLFISKYDHSYQIITCDKIMELLTSNDFKKKLYQMGEYKTVVIFINGKPNPNFSDVT